MADFDIEEVIREASYKNKKGYIDINSTDDIKFLENIMYEMDYSSDFIKEYIENVHLNEANAKDRNYNALVDVINSVLSDDRAKEDIIKQLGRLSPKEIKEILNFRKKDGNKITDFVEFINVHTNIEMALFYKGAYSGETIGRGETAALICLKNIRKGGGEADLLIQDNKFWEVKEAVKKNTFRTGGKSKPYIEQLIRFLWVINDWMIKPSYEKALNRLFATTSQFKGKDITKFWRLMAKEDKDTGEITFSEIGIGKFNDVIDFVVQFKGAVNELNKQDLPDADKEEILRIRGINRIFKVDSGTKTKLNKTKIGGNIDLSLIPDLSDTDENFIDYFSIIKTNPMLQGEEDAALSEKISEIIKWEFIRKYNGGLLFVHGQIKDDPNAIYYAFTQSQFKTNFSFGGITQGNVPKFKFDK